MSNINIPDEPSDEIRNQIHKWATTDATTIVTLPTGLDTQPLLTQEILMIIKVGTLLGVHIDKSIALDILSTKIETTIRHKTAFTAFETTNVSYPITIPIKINIIAKILEDVGLATFKYFNEQYNK